ncbi:uncharacterized protein LOC132750010 [Ruditapes philippinarum]|uniref:uncharacterized protein LOC132750010 n=1 Tax=Ruditapes philippinarum TaxID=129788 RepID=UPI00295B8372|nr:uncharacterized protein LOC132750010 [Ruditapes philippinarum]
MAEMAEMNKLSAQLRTIKRAQELARVKAGKASETPGNPDEISENMNCETQLNNEQCVSPERVNNGGNPQSLERDAGEIPERGSEHMAACADSSGLWGRISSMEESFRKREEAQTEILANIVLNVAKMQQNMQKERNGQQSIMTATESNTPATINHDGLDELLSETESTVTSGDNVDNEFLADLMNDYETKTQFGPNVNETLGKLVCNAIDSALPEEEDKKLREKYLIPENCQNLRVPKVNWELWTAFK